MRLFIYKTLFIFALSLALYKFTIGQEVKNIENKITHISSKENIENIKKKILEELSSAVEKDRILKKDEAVLIKKILNKIQLELNETN